MKPDKEYMKILEKTKILKSPKHRLSTFGETRILYYFLSEVAGFRDRSRLREGWVIAEKPKIITPDFFKNRFEGFGKKSEEFGRWLKARYGETFQGLEYRFRNESKSVKVEYSPIKALADRVKSRLEKEDAVQSAVIQGPDTAWQICLMKFIVDECSASFFGNLKDLDQHGFFDTPEKVSKDQRKEVEGMFAKAKDDRGVVPLLGRKLQSYGLFREYEDRFFKLMNG